jgi:hypothetical protein
MGERSQASTSAVDTVYGPERIGGDGSLLLTHASRMNYMLQYVGRDDGTASRCRLPVVAERHLEDGAAVYGWMMRGGAA